MSFIIIGSERAAIEEADIKEIVTKCDQFGTAVPASESIIIGNGISDMQMMGLTARLVASSEFNLMSRSIRIGGMGGNIQLGQSGLKSGIYVNGVELSQYIKDVVNSMQTANGNTTATSGGDAVIKVPTIDQFGKPNPNS